MITRDQQRAEIAVILAIADRDHLKLKLRFLALQAEGIASMSPLRSLGAFGERDVNELAKDLLAIAILLSAGADRLEQLP